MVQANHVWQVTVKMWFMTFIAIIILRAVSSVVWHIQINHNPYVVSAVGCVVVSWCRIQNIIYDEWRFLGIPGIGSTRRYSIKEQWTTYRCVCWLTDGYCGSDFQEKLITDYWRKKVTALLKYYCVIIKVDNVIAVIWLITAEFRYCSKSITVSRGKQ